MKIMKSLILLVFLIVSLIGCSMIVNEITIYKLEENVPIHEQKITDNNSIKQFISVIEKAHKNDWTAKMEYPEYKVDIGNQSYYLWLGKESGTIMNVSDNDSYYSLLKEDAIHLNKIIDKNFN